MYAHPGIMNRKMSYYGFLHTGHKLGLWHLRYVRILGIVGILKTMFGEKIINRIIRCLRI